MRHKLLLLLFGFGLLPFLGCGEDNRIFDPVPASPQGVFSITGDEAVYLYWYGPYEGDIVQFIIWRSPDPRQNYVEIGRRPADPNPALDLIIYEYVDDGLSVHNGTTYYYAVSSVDRAGQVSELSAEEVKDTPRPEGMVVLYDVAVQPSLSGYHFASYSRIDTSLADVYVDRVGNVFYLNAANVSTDLQDMGYTDSLDNIDYAPQNGWSNLGWVEIISGHTYVIWTDDFHFAKMRVESINQNSVTFSWAYQTDLNNPELIARPDGFEKPVHKWGYLRKDNNSNSLK